MLQQESWGQYQKEYEGQCMHLRINESIEQYICHPRYTHQSSITVLLNDVDEQGFPFTEECRLLDELERILRDRLEQQQASILTAVATVDGIRLYLIYSALPELCENIINEINQDWIYHSISVVSQEDENWETLEALL